MIHTHEPTDSLKICNSLVSPLTRSVIVRAAKYANAGRHMHAENLRAMGGYDRDACLAGVDKIGSQR